MISSIRPASEPGRKRDAGRDSPRAGNPSSPRPQTSGGTGQFKGENLLWDFSTHDIFIGKCKDTGEPPTREEAIRFAQLVHSECSETKFCIRHAKLGLNAAMAITKALKNKRTLYRLDLYGNMLRDSGVSAIMQFLGGNVPPPCAQTIEVLNLGCNDTGMDAVVSIAHFLKINRSVTFLELGAKPEQRPANRLSAASCELLCKVLVDHPTITALGLNRNFIGRGATEGVHALSSLVMRNQAISALCIGANEISHTSALQFIEALLNNRGLAHLNIYANSLGSQIGVALGQVLTVNNTLTVLHLHKNKIGPRGVTAIADALKVNACLVVLNMEDTDCQNDGAYVLAEALTSNLTLTSLNIANNSIQIDGSLAIAAAMRQNPVLVTLIMSQNTVRDHAAACLADALATNVALTHLELNSCKIADDGAVTIAQQLRNNSTLTTLKMRDNFLTLGACRGLVQALDMNTRLYNIDMRGNQIDFSSLSQIEQIAHRNLSRLKRVQPWLLEREVIRLLRETEKLAEVERRLHRESQANDAAHRRIANLESEIAMLRADKQVQGSQIVKNMQSTQQHVDEANARLAAKNEEYDKAEAEYAEKTKHAQMELQRETEAAETLQREIDSVQAQIDALHQTTAATKREMQEKIAKTQQAKSEALRAMLAKRDELDEMKRRIARGQAPEQLAAQNRDPPKKGRK